MHYQSGESRQITTGGLKGSYILFCQLHGEQTIAVGHLKTIHFPAGYYAYVGSALGGFKSRLSRHWRRKKKLHWHIDYLLAKARVNAIITCATEDRMECAIAQALGRQFDCIPGFGCSDCHCRSHLFWAATEMKQGIITILGSLGMKPRLACVGHSG